jgi:hypothetical protein
MNAQTSFTPEERAKAKAFDDDLAKQCQTNREQCRRAYTMLLLEAQRRLAEWGYGTKFTAQADAETVAAIRLYQQRNGLPMTGKLDGVTIVRMEADEKAVESYPFTLPSFTFPDVWPTSLFRAYGVFRDTSTGETSGPIQVECWSPWHLCFEQESTTLTPNVAKMDIKEWTGDHIIAEEIALCYTNQLRIERASKTVTHTSFKTSNNGLCDKLAALYSEELVDGVEVQLQRFEARGNAVRRVELLSGVAEALIGPKSVPSKTKEK